MGGLSILARPGRADYSFGGLGLQGTPADCAVPGKMKKNLTGSSQRRWESESPAQKEGQLEFVVRCREMEGFL